MTRVLYLDLIGGAAGDMLMAALVDAGVPLELIRAAIGGLGLHDVVVETRETRSGGLRARQIDVMVRGVLGDQEYLVRAVHPASGVALPHTHTHTHGPHRKYVDIRDRLQAAPGLGPRARALALEAFAWLARGEADAHGVPVEEVSFHEVGADDAIADIVGVATAVEHLAVDEIVTSPVPMGRGLTRGAHGPIPLPGPATVAILTGVPLAETPLRGELVTPTGAALLRTLTTRFGPIPSMVIERHGTGAGHLSWPDRPNVVRAFVGKLTSAPVAAAEEVVVEANLDDLSPQHVPGLERALFDAGALDVWSQPILMKKGRPALTISALAPAALKGALEQVFFRHSTTLGVRTTRVERTRAERTLVEVETAYGVIRVKRGERPSAPPLWMPEHEDVAAAAERHGLPERVIWEAALQAAWRS